MSPNGPPDETAPHGCDAGVALLLQAQDSGNWQALVEWLARNPQHAGAVLDHLHDERGILGAIEPRAPRAVGTTAGGLELKELVGEGGMGVVYKAFDPVLNRCVAVKTVKDAASSALELARFRFEAQVAAGLKHPNVVPVISFSSGEDTGTPFLVMPLLTGGSLADRLGTDRARVAEKDAAKWVRDVARGVHHAHERGLIHRDLKPGNILFDEAGVPHVADFGLARRADEDESRSGNIAGTCKYMAPEQARGARHLTPAVDVHALGVILFELLTGRTPFGGKDVPSTLRAVTEEQPPRVRQLRSDADRDLEAICLKCLEKRPEARYASAQELADDLDRYLRREPVKARPPGLLGRVAREVLRTQFHNAAVWGRIVFVSGLLVVAIHLFNAWAITVQLPREQMVAASAVGLLANVAVLWALLRNVRFRAGDRHTLAVWAAGLIASALLPVVYRPPEGGDLTAYRLSLYPILALIVGAMYLAQAAPFWGGFYLVGALHFALALVFAAFPRAAPVLFALSHGGTVTLVGLYLTRSAEPELAE